MNSRVAEAVRVAAGKVSDGEDGVSADDVVRAVGLPGCANDRNEGVDRLVALNAVLCRETAGSVSQTLSARGVEHFFAKGVALLEMGVYDNSERMLSDIDLYVPLSAWAEAAEALEGADLQALPENQQSGPPSMRSALSLERVAGGSIDNVQVDLHRALDPLDRLLPRPALEFPPQAWDTTLDSASLPMPAHGVHCFILLHQLVHTDLLQFHTLVDLMHLWSGLTDDEFDTLTSLARKARIGDLLASLSRLMNAELGLPDRNRQTPRHSLRLADLLRNAFSATMAERSRVTTGRIRTRLELLDDRPLWPLLSDALFPPAEFLRWRWRSPAPVGFAIHMLQVARKVVQL